MKKALTILLALLMISSCFLVTGCAKEELKLGLGIHSYHQTITNADEDVNGKGQVVATVAAVLLDKNNKIIKCEIDCADNTVQFTEKGEVVSKTDFKTKYEQKYDYNMKENGSAKEWFEQADAFEAVVIGKTIDEVKALVATDGKVNDGVISAGCTISINDFVIAIEKAVKNAVDSTATEKDRLEVAIVTEQTGSNATEEKGGYTQLEMSIVAVATDASGKVSAMSSDALQATFNFDDKGVTTTEKANSLLTKKDLGYDYKMKESGSAKEWFEQAAEFDKACIGKAADEIAALESTDGYGVDALQTAGCTVKVSGMVKATVKAAKAD